MRPPRPRTASIAILLGLCLALPARQARGAPYQGESRFFQQPNGSAVEVRLFGTEFYLRPESPDGYALAIERPSGWICYAGKAADGSLESTGIRYLGPADVETRGLLATRGVTPGLRASSAQVAARVAQVRQSLRRGSEPASTPGFATSQDVIAEARFSPTLGSGKGLVVLVDFSDRVGDISASEYEKAFNGDTYDSLGSIRTWIESISYQKYTASHTVVGYMRAAYPTSHYVGGAEFDYSASAELMKQVFRYIDDEIDLTDYASNGAMPSLVVIYPGAEIAKVWATGLWPHSGEGGYTTSEGVRIPNAFISNGGTRTPMRLSTFRHELGHSLFDWPDTYDYDDDSAGAGGFATETTLPCAPFRAWSGWMNVIDVVGVNLMYSLPANGDTCLRYKNASNAREFFMVEYMKKDGVKRADAPDEGLLIWHVDERGDNSAQDMTAAKHYVLSVEQADGLYELEKNGTKRAGDLYHAGYKDRFDDTTTPDSKWWNGTASGFTVCDIGALDPSMSVSVGCSGPVEPADMDAGRSVGSGGSGGTVGAGGSGGTVGAGGSGGADGRRDASRDGAGRDVSAEVRDTAEEGGRGGSGGTTGGGGTAGNGGRFGAGGTTTSDTSGGASGGGGASTAPGGAAGRGGASAGGGASGRSSEGAGGKGASDGSNAGGSAAGGGSSAGETSGTKAEASQAGCSCAVGSARARGLSTLGLAVFLATVLSWRRRIRCVQAKAPRP
jgi:M6 family metalloprotease-like protein